MGNEIICGIYKIVSPSGRVYIGQSVNCLYRANQYRWGAKEQRVLNNSILKYGWNAHRFEIIHECRVDELNDLEKYYATLFNSYSKEVGMNIRECGGSKGKMSEETKKLIGEANKKNMQLHPERRLRLGLYNLGKTPSEEIRAKISKSLIGKQKGKVVSKETRERLSIANTGKKHSEERRLRMSISRKGKKLSNETIEKLRIASTGKKHSEASKKKMSESQKGEKHYLYGKHLSDIVKQRISDSNKGKTVPEERRLRIGESNRGAKNGNFGKPNTPEMKRINSEKNSRGGNPNAKLVLNTETGVYYSCSKDAWDSFQRQSFEYFKFKLQGKYFNNTTFIYV